MPIGSTIDQNLSRALGSNPLRGGVIGQHAWFWSKKRGFESFPRNRRALLLGRTRHSAAFGARLMRRAARRGDAEDAHGFEAEAELLAALGGGDVMAAELFHPLQPVADRVAVGEELLRGG